MPPLFSTQQNNPNFASWLVCSVGAAWSKDAARKPNSGHHAPRFPEGQWKARRLKTEKNSSAVNQLLFDTCTYQYAHTAYTLYVLICVYIYTHNYMIFLKS